MYIQDIDENDQILTHKHRYRRVLNVKKVKGNRKLIKIVAGDHTVKCTPDHKFHTDRDGEHLWVEAQKLLLTDKVHTIFAARLHWDRLIKKTIVYSNETVYDIQVDEDESYFANGFAVHNCTICVQGASDNPYPVGSPPQVPAHILCRCIFVAITKSWEEMGIDLDEMEPGTRTAVVNGMRGEVPDTVTYQDWFEMQNTEFQADILGPSRFNAYEKGSKITDFVDNGKILSIEELKLRGLDFS